MQVSIGAPILDSGLTQASCLIYSHAQRVGCESELMLIMASANNRTNSESVVAVLGQTLSQPLYYILFCSLQHLYYHWQANTLYYSERQ